MCWLVKVFRCITVYLADKIKNTLKQMAERKKRRGKKTNRLKIRWHGFQKQTDNRVIDKQEAEWGEKEMLLSSCVCVFVWFIFILCLSWSCWPPLPITNLSCQTHTDSHIKAVHMQESLHTPFISVNKVRGSEGRKVRKNERKNKKRGR